MLGVKFLKIGLNTAKRTIGSILFSLRLFYIGLLYSKELKEDFKITKKASKKGKGDLKLMK